MKKDEYKNDFDNNSKKEFEKLLKLAQQVVVIPYNKNDTRDICYEKVGYFISNNSDILVALWDGKYTNLQGGTSEIVKYHKKSIKKLCHIKVNRFN